jgi:type II secretory ATPase GspE/PulE/Tfp pilus assembly ATPase PilB-like protein
MLRAIDRAIAEPSGLVLVSGPTGSGKTTLLYAILDKLNDGSRTITTIENPVELQMEGDGPIKQIEIQGEITFPRALRTVLRQDPEIILIGEIRDSETMEIALQAAQTGHLVFATLHANSGPETLSRALDLTLDKQRDAFRLAETVKFVMAQRLVDRFEGISVTRPLVQDERGWLQANGCKFMDSIAEVQGDSRQGKAALIEAFSMSADIKESIRGRNLNSSEIYRLACDQPQYETLAMAGVRAVQGLGSRLRDCMTRLESTTEAAQVLGLRARLARDHGLTLVQVADAIDEQCRAEDAGDCRPLEFFAEQVRAVAGAAQSAERVASQE